jgi:DNA-binding Lrp family transcriptional regulator
VTSEICDDCINADGCDLPCAAYKELYSIWREQNNKDKTIRIRNLRKQLSIGEAEVSQELRRLGDKIIRRFSEFNFIKEYGIKIGYIISHEKKQGEKITYAECRKVTNLYKAYLPYDFIITFFERNTGFLNENQLKVLMYHELRHIGIGEKGLKIVPHDIEDFKDILKKYGLDWGEPGQEVPDILDVGGG